MISLLLFLIVFICFNSVKLVDLNDPTAIMDNLEAVNNNIINNPNLHINTDEMINDKPNNPSGLFSGFSFASLPLFSGITCVGSSTLMGGKCEKADICLKKGLSPDGKSTCVADNMCCIETLKCGSTGLMNNSVFTSSNYPDGMKENGQCTMTIKKLGTFISAVRIVIEELVLSLPNELGECSIDALWVEGVDSGSEISKICGTTIGSHMYFPVRQSSDDSVRIRISISENSILRKWFIRVEQIEAINPNLPPPGCLQYFTGSSGSIMGFNVVNDTGFGNIARLRYTICLRKEVGFCKIEFDSTFYNMAPRIKLRKRAVRVFPIRSRPRLTRPMNHSPRVRMPFDIPYRPQPLRPLPPSFPIFEVSASSTTSIPIFKSELPEKSESLIAFEKLLDLKLKEYGLIPPVSTDIELSKIPSSEIINIQPQPVCTNQDVLVFPPPDDGTNSIHCGNEFHNGATLVTSSVPYLIRVNNKGSSHGLGFALRFKHIVC